MVTYNPIFNIKVIYELLAYMPSPLKHVGILYEDLTQHPPKVDASPLLEILTTQEFVFDENIMEVMAMLD